MSDTVGPLLMATIQLSRDDSGTGVDQDPNCWTATLRYDPSDPYAVTLVPTEGEPGWLFGRELLIDGIHQPVGEGDVRVWPFLDRHGVAITMIELDGDDGDAVLSTPSRELQQFVDAMMRLVPRGEEPAYLGLDALLQRLYA